MIFFESSFKQCYTRFKQIGHLLIDALAIELATVCQISNRLVKVCQDKAGYFITWRTLAVFQDFLISIHQYFIYNRHITKKAHHAEIGQSTEKISFTDIVVYQRCITRDGTCFLSCQCFFKEVVQSTHITIKSLQLLTSRHFPIVCSKVAGTTASAYSHDISVAVRLTHTTIITACMEHIGIRICQISRIKVVQIASQLVGCVII